MRQEVTRQDVMRQDAVRQDVVRQDVVRPDWRAVSKIVAHRPWPMPSSPWMMTMSWQSLLFAHWPISPAALRPHIPACLDVDTFDGEGWVGVVPFVMSNVGPRGLSRLPAKRWRSFVCRRL